MKLEFRYKCQKTWFEIKERSFNLKFKPHNTYNTNETCNYMVMYCLNTMATIVILGVSVTNPSVNTTNAMLPTGIMDLTCLTGNSEGMGPCHRRRH
jgi:hypothetical protein